MYVRKCSYPQATVYMDCLNQYGVPFEWRIDESKDDFTIAAGDGSFNKKKFLEDLKLIERIFVI